MCPHIRSSVSLHVKMDNTFSLSSQNGGFYKSADGFANTYELWNMAVAKFTIFVDIHILKYVGEIIWVEFLKFDWNIRTNKFPTHSSKFSHWYSD